MLRFEWCGKKVRKSSENFLIYSSQEDARDIQNLRRNSFVEVFNLISRHSEKQRVRRALNE